MFNELSTPRLSTSRLVHQESRSMSESLTRLLEVAMKATAKSQKPVRNFTDLADAMDESPQTIHNWSKRGVSKEGALKAEAKYGCSSNWVLTGQDKKSASAALSQRLDETRSIEERVAELLSHDQAAELLIKRLIEGARLGAAGRPAFSKQALELARQFDDAFNSPTVKADRSQTYTALNNVLHEIGAGLIPQLIRRQGNRSPTAKRAQAPKKQASERRALKGADSTDAQK
jgi:hypothetical protein